MAINSNRFCLGLLLITLLCIIIGIFLVASTLRYSVYRETGVASRRSTRNAEEVLDGETGGKGESHKEPFPVFPDDYHATGLLILPHSSIAEPFEIWYSNTLGASRIDYYYGTSKSNSLSICL